MSGCPAAGRMAWLAGFGCPAHGAIVRLMSGMAITTPVTAGNNTVALLAAPAAPYTSSRTSRN